MKKLIFITLAVVTLLSCTKDNYITEIVLPEVETIPVTIRRSQWQQGNNKTHGVHYFFEVSNGHLLTEEIFEYGVMQAFSLNRDGRERLSPLPFSDFFVDDEGYKWEEHITVEFGPRRITFILKNDDQIFVEPFFYEYRLIVRFLW
jgi:hypothetical protein